jgi:Na+-driven multidrug efflux pump
MTIIGLLNDEVKLAAVGLGNAFIIIFGLGVFVGLNGAVGTLASQAIGANQIDICGVIRWRARLVLCFVFLIILPLFIYSTQFFISVGEKKQISIYAGQYILAIIPGIITYGLLDIDRHFLNSFGMSNVAFKCQIYSPFIHGILCYFFTITLNLGI